MQIHEHETGIYFVTRRSETKKLELIQKTQRRAQKYLVVMGGVAIYIDFSCDFHKNFR